MTAQGAMGNGLSGLWESSADGMTWTQLPPVLSDRPLQVETLPGGVTVMTTTRDGVWVGPVPEKLAPLNLGLPTRPDGTLRAVTAFAVDAQGYGYIVVPGDITTPGGVYRSTSSFLAR